MHRPLTALLLVLIVSLAASGHPSLLRAQPTEPKCETPILLTSCGQSPGPEMLKVILKRLKLEFEFDPLAENKDLVEKKASGQPFKCLIVVMGASLKGMGAAGISMDDELARTSALIAEAKTQGIPVVGAHIEGLKRRAQGAAVGDNTDELSIDAVAPRSDLLIVNREGNQDRRFSIIATERKIPLIEVEKNLDLLKELELLFKE